MSYIRGQERMVYQTTYDYLYAQLTALGWFAAVGSLPFGATAAITLTEELPLVNTAVAANTVAFTEGKTTDDAAGEVGAGLFLTTFTFFVDVYGENIGIAKAIASDVRAILTGKLTGTNRYQVLTDYSVTPNVPTTALIEYKDIEVERPLNQEFQRSWEVVKVTAELQWTGAEFA